MSLRHLNIGQILLCFFIRLSLFVLSNNLHRQNSVKIEIHRKTQRSFAKNQSFIWKGQAFCAADYSLFRPPTHLLCMHTNGLTKIANEIAHE